VGLLAGCAVPSNVFLQRSRLYRIGFLWATTAATTAPNIEGLRSGLQELGYVEGQNYTIEVRYSEGKDTPLPALAAELVALNVDVLVPSSDAATRAARQATSTIPIVIATLGDPVGGGHIVSLARPGGKATGVAQTAGQESAKRMGAANDERADSMIVLPGAQFNPLAEQIVGFAANNRLPANVPVHHIWG
jgi:putative ABC transport system substrate-binding protein